MRRLRENIEEHIVLSFHYICWFWLIICVDFDFAKRKVINYYKNYYFVILNGYYYFGFAKISN